MPEMLSCNSPMMPFSSQEEFDVLITRALRFLLEDKRSGWFGAGPGPAAIFQGWLIMLESLNSLVLVWIPLPPTSLVHYRTLSSYVRNLLGLRCHLEDYGCVVFINAPLKLLMPPYAPGNRGLPLNRETTCLENSFSSSCAWMISRYIMNSCLRLSCAFASWFLAKTRPFRHDLGGAIGW